MEIVDLLSTGKELWAQLDSLEPGYPLVRHDATAEQEVAAAFVHTEFRLGRMHLDVPSDTFDDFETAEALVVAHPDHGIWFLHVSDSDERFPPLPEGLDTDNEIFFNAWCEIDEEFGWGDPPVGMALVHPFLAREDLHPEAAKSFELAPFHVFFREDLAELPNLLRQSSMSEYVGDVKSALGALHTIGCIVPRAHVEPEHVCTPDLARELFGTATPRQGIPFLN